MRFRPSNARETRSIGSPAPGIFQRCPFRSCAAGSFGDSDGPDAPHVALVSQSLAKRYWPNEDPIGRQIQFGNMDGDLHLLQVVGVVGDVRDDGLDVDMRPTVYVNFVQRAAAAAQFSFVARGQADAATLSAALRREAVAANPDMPVKMQTLKQVVSGSLDQRRFSMVIVAVFASTALLLAMVGLYGIMAYVASERTPEIGIRMALGAQRGDVLRMILRQSLHSGVVGPSVLGLLGAFGATRLLGNLLYGVNANDVDDIRSGHSANERRRALGQLHSGTPCDRRRSRHCSARRMKMNRLT